MSKKKPADKPKKNDALPRRHEVHSDPERAAPTPADDIPEGMKKPVQMKSPAEWAYERLILYIQTFEKELDNEHEVAMGFSGGDVGVLRIEGMGFFDPDILTFFGSDENGTRMQQICHVSQLNVMLRAVPREQSAGEARRIGFRLASELEKS